MSILSEFVQNQVFVASISILCMVQELICLKENSGLSKKKLPENFILGVGTAAFQIEGGWNEGGRGESMWDTYIHNHPDFVRDRSNADIATDFYHKYKEDIQLIKDLGVNYFRMSLSWPRILPVGTNNYINMEGVKYYRNVFDNLLKANITPVVTLFHWDMPTTIMEMGGWTNPRTIELFEDYARVAYDLFGNVVKIWVTINEPNQHCNNGYGSDFYVPALNASGVADYLCHHHILLAHARAYHLYDKKFRPFQKGKIGITLDSTWVEPKDSNKQEDKDAADRYIQLHMGLHAHPIFSRDGDYPLVVRQRVDYMSFVEGYTKSRLPYFSVDEVNSLRGSADFFGLNHYSTNLASEGTRETAWTIPSVEHDINVKTERNPAWPVPGSLWLSVYPRGIRRHINWISKNYGNDFPILITENGFSDYGQLNDYGRINYINDYLQQILLAIYEDGCNVQGYFAWTLMDDFEWNDGYVFKFGFYHVDFESPRRTRTPKLSAFYYRELARSRKINCDFIKKK